MPDTKADGARLFADLPPRLICALHSGATVSYREAGPQPGEPVLLHGIGGSSAGWVRQLVAPSAHLRLIALDAPGYGDAQEDAARLVADAAYASAADYLPLSARDVGVAGFARALDVLGESDGVAMAASVKQPMLIIVGAADQIAPLVGHGRRLAAAAPRARLDIVERCGHLPHFEVPTVFGNLVRGFWQEMNNCG